MDGSRGPEQPKPLPTAEQIMAQAKERIRNEPTPPGTFPNLGTNIENQSTQPSANLELPNAPASIAPYGELNSSGNVPPESPITPVELRNNPVTPEQELEASFKTIDAAKTLATGLAAAGDKQTAQEVVDALMGGKLTELDNPPTAEQFQRMADKATWDGMSLLKKIAVAIASK